METKDMILDASLDLFAKRGYAAASVRDMAKSVGIKDSSLYFHFESKQAILDALKDKFIGISTAAVEYLRQGVQSIGAMSEDLFMAVTDGYVQSYFLEPFINKFMRVLIHEQSGNAELRELYRLWCIQKPIEFQTELITRLQQIGFLKQAEPEYIAVAYYAPIFMYFHLYLAAGDIENQRQQFTQNTYAHARLFLKEYGV
jgi:AcrR family transcriptional regulator